jgi:hypothetical protein
MKYFEGLSTETEIKQRYKSLAREHHPDLGGCVETMKVINLQYESVLSGAYQTAGKSITEIDDLLEKDLVLRNKLNTIIALDGLSIEICGSWLWVTGETKTHKDTLKMNKFYWSNTKTAWYWRSESKKSFNRKPMSLEQIRHVHGTHTIQRREYAMVS